MRNNLGYQQNLIVIYKHEAHNQANTKVKSILDYLVKLLQLYG